MPDITEIEGKRVRFRLVSPEDAEYIQSLRTSPDYGRHLSPPAPSVEAQRAWIEGYKVREAAGIEYYFIVERLDDGRRCGTMRIYDIGADEATWGSFILDSAKPEKAAFDALLLVHKVIFQTLKLNVARFDVRRANTRALQLYRRFGGVETGADALNIYFRITPGDIGSGGLCEG